MAPSYGILISSSRMGSERIREGPVVLQLQRWDTSSQSRLDISEFREAFLSPTRKLLLLQSFCRDALLLPLIRGQSVDFNNEDFNHENLPRMRSQSSPSSTMPSGYTSHVKTDSSEGLSWETNAGLARESTCSENNCPYISDVNSIAWGLCADTNMNHKEALFRELLFVSGNHGVTVHAFCELHENTATFNSSAKVEKGNGQWFEWVPSTASADCSGTSGDKATSRSINGDKEGPYCSGDKMSTHCARSHSSKKWLRSYLTSVENKKSDGFIWTPFPDKSVFPCSAKVVSFHIFNDDSLFLDILSHRSAVTYTGVRNKLDKPVGDFSYPAELSSLKHDLKTDGNGGSGSSYQCFKIFSSNSYDLIGFAFIQVNAAIYSSGKPRERSRNVVVLVSRMNTCAMQWICSVKLEQEDENKAATWIDFQFSDNLLVCLNASGLILFFGVMTGVYVACLDILETFGLKPRKYMQVQEEKLAPFKDERNECDKFLSEDGKGFRKLIGAPYTSLLAAVDEHGAVYVICVSDHVPEMFYSLDRLPQLRFGLLSPWIVGNADISCQKVLLTNSTSSRSDESDIMWKGFSDELSIVDNWCLHGRVSQADLSSSGFAERHQKNSEKSPQSRRSLHCRKLFLPTTESAVNDMICFSSFGITRLSKRVSSEGKKCSYVAHTNLLLETNLYDDKFSNFGVNFDLKTERETVIGDVVGCIFHGCFYLVTVQGFSVILPSMSISSHFHPIESIGYTTPTQFAYDVGEIMKTKEVQPILPPWKVEILDRVLLFEGSDGADLLCRENGWDLQVSRLRRLQLALGYLKFDEIEQSLENLAAINMAEEGILRLVLATVYIMFDRAGGDNEISAASRLLKLATRFATNTIREYALLEHKFEVEHNGAESCYLLPLSPYKECGTKAYAGRLDEMSHLLVITRNLQRQVASKFSRPVQGSVNDDEALQFSQKSQMSTLAAEAFTIENINNHERGFSVLESGSKNAEKLELIPAESFDAANYPDYETIDLASVGKDMVSNKHFFPVENPMEMIARWEIDKLDLKNVVKDALLSGRLPLAVLKLHLRRSKELADDKDPNDIFTEVLDVGRSIAYDLFMKGETGLAVATLQNLGEDVEGCLRQLLFGTLNRLLRNQIIEEMKKYGYLRPYELAILDRLSLIERIYPSNSFWRTYLFQKQELNGNSTTMEFPTENNFRLLYPHSFGNVTMECGEVNGVVLGSWTDLNENSIKSVDQDSNYLGYWASAAVWFNAWDQKTIDRILLDQPFVMGVHVIWESQLEYHICHNDWVEVLKLLDMIPTSLTPIRSLQISLDGLQSTSSFRCGMELPLYLSYVYSPDELDAVYADIPNVRIFQTSVHFTCSTWLRMLLDKHLAKKLIFLKDYWDSTAEILSLIARSGFVVEKNKRVFQDEHVHEPSDLGFQNLGGDFQQNTLQELHKLLIHHCSQYKLPYLLDLYLDHQELALETESLGLLQDAAVDCQWAKWLLFSRIKGFEYDASLCNARTIISRDIAPLSNLTVLQVNDLIHTVDDIAENGWLMAALGTLMFAPLPMENCLSSGTVKRRSSSSAQCTLENLRSALQRFPTLWRILVAACLGNNTTYDFRGPSVRTVGNSALSVYLNWRDNVFYSSDHDASLLQLLPCWFPKALRRLIQLFVQGPLGWQALANLPAGEAYLQRDIEVLINAGQYSDISAMSWEAAIQKQIEQELYASSVEETGLGIEHHLHRGRALAAFSHLLGYRVQKLKTERENGGLYVSSVRGQLNGIHVDMQKLMATVGQSEESLLSMIMPIAITNYQNSMLVASCAFFLELCGLSPTMLRVDVASLRRISNFYSSNIRIEEQKLLGPKDSMLHAVSEEGAIADSLARALADIYLQLEKPTMCWQEGYSTTSNSGNLSRALMLVLQHLEKACLPQLPDGMTCGSWLVSGRGDGSDLRSQQKAASQHWNLVMVFCQLHQIPLSTKYLALLARDNDWVGFLLEAQIGGYPFDTVIQLAKKEFKDPRLQTHILTVLRGMQSRGITVSSQNSSILNHMTDDFSMGQGFNVPAELFEILAECEKQRQPGKALLIKAKQLSWSMLAIIASCFPDVTAFSCLTVWLEITAARDASLLKENDIATQIANNVGAAVKALNSLPAYEPLPTVYYSRKTTKRRRLFDPFAAPSGFVNGLSSDARASDEGTRERVAGDEVQEKRNSDDWSVSLPKMLSVLCEQQQFLPLLRAFEMFLPSCSLLSFIRALQAFSQMRLSEASAHLGSFSARIKEEPTVSNLDVSWISSTASKAANSILSNCPSPYEKRCLLQLLAATNFGDGGYAATYYRQQYWKINLAEPALRKNDDVLLGNNTLDDASLLTTLEKNGHWEQARTWAQQLEASDQQWNSAGHHVTETQAESMVAEWKEFLWDVPEERVALWGHCQTLFIRYSFPALQAGLFFLKHAEAVERDLPSRELHELLLLSLQWLSGMITKSNPVYQLHLLREIETRVWLLAVESEAQMKSERDLNLSSSNQEQMYAKSSNMIDKTADIILKMDSHLNAMKNRASEKVDGKESNFMQLKSSQAYLKGSKPWDTGISTATNSMKSKRQAKAHGYPRRFPADTVERSTDLEDGSTPLAAFRNDLEDENVKAEASLSKWEDRIGPAELERAVLSLLEFGQISAAKQLQHKLSPTNVPLEFKFVDAALKLAELSTPPQISSLSLLDKDLCSVIQSYDNFTEDQLVDTLQVLDNLSFMVTEGSGRGLCKRIVAVVKAANVLDISFSEAFEKQPTELLQLLSLKAQDSFEEAKLLIQTHSMPATSIARILAESFLKGLLAAHRGGYIDSQKEEGPAPLLWRFSDFLRWAELCPSEPEVGHALMRLVITGQEIPHSCEVELLILSHHFYKLSACLDGVDVLVALAATRVEAYVAEGDFSCLARLLTGVGNFHALNFILGILIENEQLDLLLQKYSAAADANTSAAEAGFRMAVLTSLKHFNPNDHDAFAMVYKHFDMKHEAASLLESRARLSSKGWQPHRDRYQHGDLLESMRYYIEAAEVYSSIDAGNKTHTSCAQASLVSLQIRMPDLQWLKLPERNARSTLVNQSRFQEALIVAEAYNLNQPSEWVPVLWNQMPKPELLEQFVSEFVAVLPLQSSMLVELAKIYRSEVVARGDQSNFAVWLTGGGGLPVDVPRYLSRSFRCLLMRTRDLRLRVQLASVGTGFNDVIKACNKELDKVPDNAGPLVLRKGHGGAYLPLH
ncbi:hypothetical protein V2J09_002250 [Rumex salicifolius]